MSVGESDTDRKVTRAREGIKSSSTKTTRQTQRQTTPQGQRQACTGTHAPHQTWISPRNSCLDAGLSAGIAHRRIPNAHPNKTQHGRSLAPCLRRMRKAWHACDVQDTRAEHDCVCNTHGLMRTRRGSTQASHCKDTRFNQRRACIRQFSRARPEISVCLCLCHSLALPMVSPRSRPGLSPSVPLCLS